MKMNSKSSESDKKSVKTEVETIEENKNNNNTLTDTCTETMTNGDDETDILENPSSTLKLDELDLRQDLRDAHTKLEDEKKKSKSWHDKYKDMKNRYGRVDKHLQEEKKRRTEIENHHEQVYSCTRNKLKIVNDAKSCLEAENRKLKSTIDRFIAEM